MLRLNTRIGGSDSTPTTAFAGPRRCRFRTKGVTTPALAPVHAQTRLQVRPRGRRPSRISPEAQSVAPAPAGGRRPVTARRGIRGARLAGGTARARGTTGPAAGETAVISTECSFARNCRSKGRVTRDAHSSSQAGVSGDRAETLARRGRRALWRSRGAPSMPVACVSIRWPPARGLTARRA